MNKENSKLDSSQNVTVESDNQESNTELTREKEIGGAKGPEPTRYGDWEKNGRCSDF
jgi:hypothetical protein